MGPHRGDRGEPLPTVAEDPEFDRRRRRRLQHVEPSPRINGASPAPTRTRGEYFTSTNVQDIVGGVNEPGIGLQPNPPTTFGFGWTCGPGRLDGCGSESGYLLFAPSSQASTAGAPAGLGRHQLRRAAAQRLDGGDRLLRRPPGRVLEPIDLRFATRSARRSVRSTRRVPTTTTCSSGTPEPSTTRRGSRYPELRAAGNGIRRSTLEAIRSGQTESRAGWSAGLRPGRRICWSGPGATRCRSKTRQPR